MLGRNVVQASRHLSSTRYLNKQVQNVTIIGAGLMGSGIAQVSAQAKINVYLVDQKEAALQKAQKGIESSLSRVAKKKFADDAEGQKKFVGNATQFIKTTTDVEEAVKNADLVIEAIVENIDVKRDLFAQLEKNAKSDAILTTNTSSLKLSDIGLNLKNKKNFGGLHFFNPVPMMKLLEVVRHADTSDETFQTLNEYGKAIGKTTVACKDTPGFIVNRLLVPYMFEALRMYERGDASMEDIDVAMKLGAGYPMGPFELTDYVGLDTSKFIMDGWHKAYPDEPLFKPSKFLTQKVADGKFGRKSGEGFYNSRSFNRQIKNVTVIGAGIMGSGIAQVSAQAQINVFLKKFADDAAGQKKFVSDVSQYIKTTTDLKKGVRDADLVIEAIVENLDVKRALLAQLEKDAKSDAILTSNTSSLKLSDIGLNLKNKKNFGGLHFFNPVPMMKLLEVVKHSDTSDDTFNKLNEYGKAIGKTTVACKDTPGFIVNRLLVPYMFEALRMYERGDASMEDIDIAMKLGAGYPMGPFELSDYGGLDTAKFISDGWHKAYPDEPLFRPSRLLEEKVSQGKLGRKSGEGFYKHK
ncbi:unnamed protein product, partial [Mesorhabditis spiculigera]